MLPLVTAAGMSLLKLGGATAAVGGTTAALSQGVLSIPGARNLLGATASDIAKGESYDLNDPSSYRDDINDYLRSLFTGVSTDQVKEAAKQQAIKRVNQGLKPSYERVRTGYKKLGLEAPDISEFQYQGTEGTDASSFRAEDRLGQLKALQDANAAGVDIAGLANASQSAIRNAITSHREAKTEALYQKREGERKKEQAEIFARQDAKEARLRADTMRQQIRRDEQAEANRAMEFQIQQMQLGLENRRLDMQEARNFRQDRQKAIMQIMQGFQQMGNAFAY